MPFLISMLVLMGPMVRSPLRTSVGRRSYAGALPDSLTQHRSHGRSRVLPVVHRRQGRAVHCSNGIGDRALVAALPVALLAEAAPLVSAAEARCPLDPVVQ